MVQARRPASVQLHRTRAARDRRSQPAGRERRVGAALVEFAVSLPVLVLIVLGSIETATAVFVRQGLTVAAYEGIREAIRRDGEASTATARAQAILDQRSIKGTTIAFSPADPSQVARGDTVTVQIEAAVDANSPFFGLLLRNRIVRVSTVMVRE